MPTVCTSVLIILVLKFYAMPALSNSTFKHPLLQNIRCKRNMKDIFMKVNNELPLATKTGLKVENILNVQRSLVHSSAAPDHYVRGQKNIQMLKQELDYEIEENQISVTPFVDDVITDEYGFEFTNASPPQIHIVNLEATTQLDENDSKSSTFTKQNETDTFFHMKKDDFLKLNYNYKLESNSCICDLKVNECDINCCCDPSCGVNMIEIFTKCEDSKEILLQNWYCNLPSLFKNNRVGSNDGLFCIIKNNLISKSVYKEREIISNVPAFKSMIVEKKIFSFSTRKFHDYKMHNLLYQMGDVIWCVKGNKIVPFGLPHHDVDFNCKTEKYVSYLLDSSTKCVHPVPDNKMKCENSAIFGMSHFLKNNELVKSPSVIVKWNSTHGDKLCSNETCAHIASYVCPGKLDFASCINTSSMTVFWDGGVCKNIVTSVEYHFLHNGSQGLREVKAYFLLSNISSYSERKFVQHVKLKFKWFKITTQTFVRSGNPGYLNGKPVVAGRKIVKDNETSSMNREAIELSINPMHWLSIFDNRGSLCISDFRKPVNFGENLHNTCNVKIHKNELAKEGCSKLQEKIYYFLLGNDLNDIKLKNDFNKFVATFGNSRPEETGDWVKVLIDTSSVVSTKVSFVSSSDTFMCKNLVTDLFIDIAYSEIGSFEMPQAKILGVHFYFGTPKNFLYHQNANYNSNSIEIVKISTLVKFIDVTLTSVKEFAETPGIEAKLPYDFFYPFTGGSKYLLPNTIVLFCSILIFFAFKLYK